MTSSSTVAVIGANGFVGRGVVRGLRETGTIAVRPFARTGGHVQGLAVAPLPEHPSAFAGIDAVIHLAAIAHGKVDDATYQDVNVGLARRMAALALKAGVARFVFASSIGVHGRWNPTPILPESPMRPVTAYGRSKMEAELRLTEDLEGSETKLAIARPPVVYGAGAQANFGQLLRAATMGLPLPLGSAMAKRSMVSLTNVSNALAFLAQSGLPSTGPAVLIPADSEDLTVRDLYERLCVAVGRGVHPIPFPPAALGTVLGALGRAEMFESLFRPAVVDRAHWRSLGWSPPEPIDVGLRAAVEPARPET